MNDNDLLIEGAKRLGISLTNSQLVQFDQYQQLLVDWNQRMNLTAIREIEEIQERHFLDSLTCVLAACDLNKRTLIDVGSGAGFPGLPLKICFPGLTLTLIESVKKKAGFLQAVIEALGLNDVHIFALRAEDIGRSPDHRENYDWAVARAVAPLRVLAEYLLPLTRIGGHMLAQKGITAAEDLLQAEKALYQLGGGPSELIPVEIFGKARLSYLVKVEKINLTPEQYPRRAGVPTRRPL